MNQQNNNNQQLPRRSRRLATILPASHWIGLGYSEDDAELMEKLQNDMKKYCDSGDPDIKLQGKIGTGTLNHHDLMIPHWKKFAKALQGRTSVDDFFITGISLPASLLDIVFPALQLVNIVELTLIGTGLGGEGFRCLSSYLENNSSLRRLGLGVNRLDDLLVATALSDALNNHPTLEEVYISQCFSHNASILEKILQGCTTKKSVLMTMENFDSDSDEPLVEVVADFIRSNHPVEKLYLRGNNITNNDTLPLALALKTDKHLKLLDLRKNDITEVGERALLKAMYDPESMDSIIESNHTCMAYTYDTNEPMAVASQPSLETEVIKINANKEYSIGQKIRKKVVLALCGQDGEVFDLSHFNELPLGVMPRVLELIQEHTITRTKIRFNHDNGNTSDQLEKDALSRLFHTLRGWELPSLFVNLNTPSANVTTGRRKRRKTRR